MPGPYSGARLLRARIGAEQGCGEQRHRCEKYLTHSNFLPLSSPESPALFDLPEAVPNAAALQGGGILGLRLRRLNSGGGPMVANSFDGRCHRIGIKPCDRNVAQPGYVANNPIMVGLHRDRYSIVSNRYSLATSGAAVTFAHPE